MARGVLLRHNVKLSRKRGLADMNDRTVSQARAQLSRATFAVIAALGVLSTAGMEVAAKHAASFVATDLGTLGGSFSEALAVSSTGVVVGRSSIKDDNAVHAFVWSEHTGMTDLQPDIQPSLSKLGGALQSLADAIGDDGIIAGFGFLTDESRAIVNFHAFTRTRANGVVDLSELGKFDNSLPTAVNSKGAVVGFANRPGDANSRAFLWTQQRGVEDLGTLGGSSGTANAISDNGIVVGQSATSHNLPHAFMWTRHTGMVDLGTLDEGLTSAAQAVNDDGVIVGSSQTTQMASDGHAISHAFVWTRRTGMVDIVPDRFDGLDSFAERINGRFVIGQTFVADGTGPKHGFAWTAKDGFVDIGTLGGDASFAAGVNDQGLVVGNSQTAGNAAIRAFVWSASTRTMVPLDSGDGTSTANAITDNFIVGSSCDAGNCHATLWKPNSRSRKDRRGNDD
jgi:probable HAF family extracellular repeat protein